MDRKMPNRFLNTTPEWNPPLLQYTDFTKPFIATIDASNLALRTALSQEGNFENLPATNAAKPFKTITSTNL